MPELTRTRETTEECERARLMGVEATDHTCRECVAEGGNTVSDETKVRVPLQDLCSIAETVAGMMHDLDNGKRKYLDIDISNIHVITERWAEDETVLGGGCHPDHRCRLCRDFPVLTQTGTTRSQQTDAVPSAPADQQDPEPAELSSPTLPAEDKDMNEKTHYNYRDAVFILDPLSESVVKVTHRDQVGYFGFNRKWDPSRPYTRTDYRGSVYDDGIEGMSIFTYSSPDAALNSLCDSMLRYQRKEDARRTNPEERKRAARRVLGEFLEELPN